MNEISHMEEHNKYIQVLKQKIKIFLLVILYKVLIYCFA
jgi:hypothetical protein